jgi:hypothetical protein
MTERFWFVVHNVVAHPLLVLLPPVGGRLHEFSANRMGGEVDQ